MCVAIPGKILKVCGDYAHINIMGIESDVNIKLIEEVQKNDYVLVHAGCAIEKIDYEYFSYLEDILKEALGSH